MKYRPEIDGLRALAVMPVMLFHAGFATFSGGYVGVDVFFVISGYLITSIILSEIEQGSFSLINFYERRARRILPALFFVILITLPLAWLWLLPRNLKDYSESLIAVATFCSNIFFWRENNYFDMAAELKPLLHTWSLAVEEQFYLLFPLFMLIFWRFGRSVVVVLLLIVGLLSLGLSQWGAIDRSSAAFYLLPTRGWELLMGAFVPLVWLRWQKRPDASGYVSQALSLLGLLMVIYAVLSFDHRTAFPGFYAVIPTLGTLLMIMFAMPGTWVHRLLSQKLLVGIGLISYSAYLIHQPILAFAKYRNLGELSESLGAIFILASLILGYLCWRWVERPFRDRSRFSRQQIFVFAAGGTVLTVLAGVIGIALSPVQFFLTEQQEQLLVSTQVTDMKIRGDCSIDYDPAQPYAGLCLISPAKNQTIQPAFAVFGDSHSAVALHGFDRLARESRLDYAHSGLGGCLPLVGVDVAMGNYAAGVCRDFVEGHLAFVEKHNIPEVFLVARWTLYAGGAVTNDKSQYFLIRDEDDEWSLSRTRENFVFALHETVRRYQALGAKVHFVEQAPEQHFNPFLSITYYDQAAIPDVIRERSVTVEQHHAVQAYNREMLHAVAQETSATVVTVDQYLCNDRVCPVGSQKRLYYNDSNHLSDYGAELLVDSFRQALQ